MWLKFKKAAHTCAPREQRKRFLYFGELEIARLRVFSLMINQTETHSTRDEKKNINLEQTIMYVYKFKKIYCALKKYTCLVCIIIRQTTDTNRVQNQANSFRMYYHVRNLSRVANIYRIR